MTTLFKGLAATFPLRHPALLSLLIGPASSAQHPSFGLHPFHMHGHAYQTQVHAVHPIPHPLLALPDILECLGTKARGLPLCQGQRPGEAGLDAGLSPREGQGVERGGWIVLPIPCAALERGTHAGVAAHGGCFSWPSGTAAPALSTGCPNRLCPFPAVGQEERDDLGCFALEELHGRDHRAAQGSGGV